MEILQFQDDKFQGIKVAVDWINDLESSDSRIHKENVIEKALMAAKLGSSSAQCFLYNCYLAYNPFFTFNVKKVPETKDLIDKEVKYGLKKYSTYLKFKKRVVKSKVELLK